MNGDKIRKFLAFKPRDYAIMFYLYKAINTERHKGFPGHNHPETAKAFNLSGHRIRQIHEKGRDIIADFFDQTGFKKIEIDQMLFTAIHEARRLSHPSHIGLSDNDRREIKSYNVALDNLTIILSQKGLMNMPAYLQK